MTHKQHGMHKGNPDKGPQMHEGAHHWDKGYTSDSEMSHGGYPEKQYRGNEYLRLQNEILSKDAKKLRSDKFSKIA
jgi:hypothetical protein